MLATVEQAFTTVGDLLARQRIKAATAEAMRAVGEVNAYVSRTEPFKLKGDDQRERLATVLHTLIQCVSDLNTILAPVLPHAANRVHAVLGGRGQFMPMPVIAASLFARFASRQEVSPALQAVAALRGQFGGHAVMTSAEGDALRRGETPPAH